MKKKNQKLTLKRETILKLSDSKIRGGMIVVTQKQTLYAPTLQVCCA